MLSIEELRRWGFPVSIRRLPPRGASMDCGCGSSAPACPGCGLCFTCCESDSICSGCGGSGCIGLADRLGLEVCSGWGCTGIRSV